MSAMASQITSLTIVYSTVYSGADQRKHQRSASLAFVRGIHQRPVNSLHKGPVTRKMSPFEDVIMASKPRTSIIAVNQILTKVPLKSSTDTVGYWSSIENRRWLTVRFSNGWTTLFIDGIPFQLKCCVHNAGFVNKIAKSKKHSYEPFR